MASNDEVQASNGDPAAPSGSRASHEAASASSPKASIPIARPSYETIVFRFDSPTARRAFFAHVLPGNPFNGTPIPGVAVSAMALYDVMTAFDIYEEALEAIADGRGDAWEIADAAIDKAQERFNTELGQGGDAAGSPIALTSQAHQAALADAHDTLGRRIDESPQDVASNAD